MFLCVVVSVNFLHFDLYSYSFYGNKSINSPPGRNFIALLYFDDLFKTALLRTLAQS